MRKIDKKTYQCLGGNRTDMGNTEEYRLNLGVQLN